MADQTIVETKELTKRYDEVTVVDHLNLRVAEGEIFGLLGPNGAGKTTTILMLIGLTEPSAGEVKVCGFDPTHEPLKVKRLVGYMPEKVGFYENLTAKQNLDFTAHLNGISPDISNKRADNLLAAVGIGPAPVEHVLAVGVGLPVAGHRGDQRRARAQREVMRLPAAVAADAAAGLQRREEFVTQERVRFAGESVPLAGGNLGYRGQELCPHQRST